MNVGVIFGANLVQHFMRRYSRYSRYRTKSHDKATISHDITRYSRYQTVLSKLQKIITHLGLFQYTKSSASAELFCFKTYYISIVGVDVLGDPNESKLNGTPGRSSPTKTRQGGSICKEPRRPVYFLPFLWYNTTNRST